MDNISKGLDEAISEELANPPKAIAMNDHEKRDPRTGEITLWRMAEQYFRYADFELTTEPRNAGYVMTIKLGIKTRRVFFDPAGRITHVSHVANLNQIEPT